MDLPCSLPSMDIWDCWEVASSITDSIISPTLPPSLPPRSCTSERQFGKLMQLCPEGGHFLSAASWVIIRMQGVGSVLIRKFMTLLWLFPGMMLLLFYWWEPQTSLVDLSTISISNKVPFVIDLFYFSYFFCHSTQNYGGLIYYLACRVHAS